MADTIVAQLEQLLGDESVVAWEDVLPELKTGLARTSRGQPIQAVVFPATIAQLSEVVTWAERERQSIVSVGSGSKVSWGGLTDANVAVCTARLNRVVEHAVGDLTVTAEAGIPIRDITRLLEPHRQQLGVDPAFPDRATLGGIIATGDTGSLRQSYGSLRDHLLGVTFVRSDGQVVKAGGRVVKNVAGYDLMKLMTGSYGTLGILAQVTVRVYPVSEASKTVVVQGDRDALATVAQQIRSSSLVPTRFDWVSCGCLRKILKTESANSEAGLLLQFQSIAASVDRQVQGAIALAESAGLQATAFSETEDSQVWLTLQQSLYRQDVPPSDSLVGCKFGVLPTRASAFIHALGDRGDAQIHASSGIGWVCFPQTPATDTLLELRALCQANSGYFCILQAPKSLKQGFDIWGYAEGSQALMRAIATKFDPHSIFNPQRLFPNG